MNKFAPLITLIFSQVLSVEAAHKAVEETSLCYDPVLVDRANSYKDTGAGTVESITYEVNCDDLVLTAKMITKKDETRGISANLESLKISMQTFFCSPLGRFSSNFDAGWKIRFNIHNNENSDVYGFWIVNCDTTQDVLSTS